ncbi:DUF424 family protein [Candidatus Woesearchaeota archaeon]|nr:DUF424 family protein [Candidatus Woesearchaeota archaeon]
MIAKLHKSHEGRVILAVCDSDIIGKCYEEGKKQLDLSSNFYKGEEMDEERILNLMKSVHIVNLCGEKAVKLGVKAGIIDKDRVIRIKGVPHAEGVIVQED